MLRTAVVIRGRTDVVSVSRAYGSICVRVATALADRLPCGTRWHARRKHVGRQARTLGAEKACPSCAELTTWLVGVVGGGGGGLEGLGAMCADGAPNPMSAQRCGLWGRESRGALRAMDTPPRPPKLSADTPEKVVEPPPCSAFLPPDYVEVCGRRAEIQVVLPNGRGLPGLSFCARCFFRADLQAAYRHRPAAWLR